MRNHTLKLLSLVVLLSMLVAPALTQAQGLVSLAVQQVKAYPDMGVVATVADQNGVPIPGLTQASFDVTEDGRPVTLSQVVASANPDVKITIALGIDASGSMKGKPFQDAREAVIKFLDTLNLADEGAIVVFSEKVDLGEPFPKLAQGKEMDFTADKGALKNLLLALPDAQDGRTPLYDALFKLVKMTARQPIGRRAVILFTDGREQAADEKASVLQPDDPIVEAQRLKIPIFTIGLGPEADAEYLQRAAIRTGGTYAHADVAGDLGPLFRDIANRLKLQYTLEWKSGTRVDYAKHKATVKARTSLGEPEASFEFIARPAVGPAITGLFLKDKAGERPLDGMKITGSVTLRADVGASGATNLARVEYYVNDRLVGTSLAAPWALVWDTCQVAKGPYTVTAKAFDDATPPNVAEMSAQVTIDRGLLPCGTGGWVTYAAVGGLVVVLAVVALILLRRRPQQARVCPVCLRVMDPQWTECMFCAQEGRTAGAGFPGGPNAGVEAPTGAGFEPVTGSAFEPVTGVSGPMGDAGTEPTFGPVGMRRPDQTIALRPKATALGWLIMEKGERPGKDFRLSEGDTSVGRSGDNDIISDPTVGRQQAKIRLEKGVFYIFDLASTNPTRVNGQVITRHALQDNDRIEMGETVLIFKQIKQG